MSELLFKGTKDRWQQFPHLLPMTKKVSWIVFCQKKERKKENSNEFFFFNLDILDHKNAKECKLELRKHLEKGCLLSTNQARRAFSQYLQHVLARLGPPLEGPNAPSELCLKFLQRSAGNLRSPFFVKVNLAEILTRKWLRWVFEYLKRTIFLRFLPTNWWAKIGWPW